MSQYADIEVYETEVGSQIWINGQPTTVHHIEVETSYDHIQTLDRRVLATNRQIEVTLTLPVDQITYIQKELTNDHEEDQHEVRSHCRRCTARRGSR